MPRTKKIDPVLLDRMRVARAAEDSALVAVTAAQASVEAAVEKRATVLAALDAEVSDAEGELAHARADLVAAAGFDRAAHALGMSSAALRKQLPTGAHANGREVASSSARFVNATVPAGGDR